MKMKIEPGQVGLIDDGLLQTSTFNAGDHLYLKSPFLLLATMPSLSKTWSDVGG